MAFYCLDASVVLAWLLEQKLPLVYEFFDTLSADDNLCSAAFLYAECTSNIREAVFIKRLEAERAQRMVHRLVALDLSAIHTPELSRRAYELAAQFQHRKAYDDHYVAAAELSGSELVTMDRGMRHAAQQIGVPVRFLR